MDEVVIVIFWQLFQFLKFFCRTRDSGFNSEIPSCGCGIGGEQQELPSALLASDLNSGFLAQYGLDGPLDEYPDDPEEEEGGLDLLGMPPAPSATSINTKRKRKEEMKQATIRQHYYPEGMNFTYHSSIKPENGQIFQFKEFDPSGLSFPICLFCLSCLKVHTKRLSLSLFCILGPIIVFWTLGQFWTILNFDFWIIYQLCPFLVCCGQFIGLFVCQFHSFDPFVYFTNFNSFGLSFLYRLKVSVLFDR